MRLGIWEHKISLVLLYDSCGLRRLCLGFEKRSCGL
jgi:hypothetical protein